MSRELRRSTFAATFRCPSRHDRRPTPTTPPTTRSGGVSSSTEFLYYAETMAKGGWGFDPREIDARVRPQDDFFRYVNARWMKANPVPAHESRWGTFIVLRYKTERQLRALLHEVISKKNAAKGSPEQMIRDFYRSGMDMK